MKKKFTIEKIAKELAFLAERIGDLRTDIDLVMEKQINAQYGTGKLVKRAKGRNTGRVSGFLK